MRVVSQNDGLIFSHPETITEKQFMEKISGIARAIGSSTIEFKVSTMGMNGNTTHVGLEPVIPEGFEFDPFGYTVDSIPSRCQHCGGSDH